MEQDSLHHGPTALLRGKEPWYPLDMWPGGPQSRSGCGGEEKSSHTVPRLEPPIIQPIAQLFETQIGPILSEMTKTY